MNEQKPILKPHEISRTDLLQDFAWFKQVLNARIALYFGLDCDVKSPCEIKPPEFSEANSLYSKIINSYGLSPEERLIIMLALAPEIETEALDPFFIKNSKYDRGHSEFGGIISHRHSGFLPTFETALFLLTGGDTNLKLAMLPILQAGSILIDHWILDMDACSSQSDGTTNTTSSLPYSSEPLRLSDRMLGLLRDDARFTMTVPQGIPAILLETALNWEDLIVTESTSHGIEQVFSWLEHRQKLSNLPGLGKHLKPGYTAMFHGPPGTGKTLTAGLIGKRAGMPVVAVDLSQLVSKYIGETEKNLNRMFIEAERRGWILFFDEADAIFGKRTQVSSSNDRHANTETAFLLQRLESFAGLVILASNLPANIDEAYLRRFQSMIHFPAPDVKMRQALYKNCIGTMEIPEGLDLPDIAKRFEVTGATITSAMRYAWLQAFANDHDHFTAHDLMEGLRTELAKHGKSS